SMKALRHRRPDRHGHREHGPSRSRSGRWTISSPHSRRSGSPARRGLLRRVRFSAFLQKADERLGGGWKTLVVEDHHTFRRPVFDRDFVLMKIAARIGEK